MAHTEYRIYHPEVSGRSEFATIADVRRAVWGHYPDRRNRAAAMDLLVNHGMAMRVSGLEIWSVTVCDDGHIA